MGDSGSFNMVKVDTGGGVRGNAIFRPYKPSTKDEEILYSARINRHNSLVLAKWDGHKEPVETYTITNRGKGKCDCQGSSRNPYCKHRKMVDAWEKISASPDFMGEFYNNDTGTLYTPEDGEGVPTRGVIDLA